MENFDGQNGKNLAQFSKSGSIAIWNAIKQVSNLGGKNEQEC